VYNCLGDKVVGDCSSESPACWPDLFRGRLAGGWALRIGASLDFAFEIPQPIIRENPASLLRAKKSERSRENNIGLGK
jgi:hypothetical protein